MTAGRVILVAEDEENDFHLLGWAFAKHKEKVWLIRVRDGAEAISYLEGKGCYADRKQFPAPDLCFLDLKMPLKDGFDVLEWLKAHPEYRPPVLIVLSSSRNERDVARAYKLGVNSYLAKPNDSVGLVQLTKVIIDFWFRCAQIPDQNNGG